MNVAFNEKDQRDLRKDQLSIMAKRYYEKFEFLHDKPIDQFIQETLDTYLDSNLTIEEVNEQFMDTLLSKKNEEKQESSDDLSLMLEDNQIREETKDRNEMVQHPVFIKKKKDFNEEGYINNIIITTLALITFSLCFIGIAVLYLLQM